MATKNEAELEAPEGGSAPPAENKVPFIPSFRVVATDKGRAVVKVDEHGKEHPVSRAPAEAWAELRGHVDPVPTPAMPRHPLSAYQGWIYEAAKVQWGGDGKVWRPGAPGKEMTADEYDGHVKAALGARATSTGEPPAKEK